MYWRIKVNHRLYEEFLTPIGLVERLVEIFNGFNGSALIELWFSKKDDEGDWRNVKIYTSL